jgi:hypothetical protein
MFDMCYDDIWTWKVTGRIVDNLNLAAVREGPRSVWRVKAEVMARGLRAMSGRQKRFAANPSDTHRGWGEAVGRLAKNLGRENSTQKTGGLRKSDLHRRWQSRARRICSAMKTRNGGQQGD